MRGAVLLRRLAEALGLAMQELGKRLDKSKRFGHGFAVARRSMNWPGRPSPRSGRNHSTERKRGVRLRRIAPSRSRSPIWQRRWFRVSRGVVVIASLIVGVTTAPLLLDDVPEGLGRWDGALATVGGRPVEIVVLTLSALLFFLGMVAPGLMRRRDRAQEAAVPQASLEAVLGDIQHRDGCPAARLESYPQTRPDGIEVAVGRCMDCGAAAYRHGDVPADPSPPPVQERDHPHVALANQAERRAAGLRALCQRWDGPISRGKLLPYGVPDEQAAIALADALAEYESDHSIEIRAIVRELVAATVLDADCRRLVEDPKSLADLRALADHLQDAAERMKVKPPDPAGVDRVALLREAYRVGAAIREGNIWGEGAPIDHKGLARATSRAWDRAAEWGVDTYGMLRDYFPGPYERAFLGPDSDGNHGLGTTGFRLQVSAERNDGRAMPDDWMNAKLKLLSDMLGEYDR